MKKKLCVVLTCGVMMTGLVACGSSDKTSASNESKPKQEEKKEDVSSSSKNETNTKEKQELGKDKKGEKFEDFDPEYQLAIVMRFFNDVTVKYDYAIGNPEYMLQESMNQNAIDDMKKLLQEQAKNNEKLLKDEVNQAVTFLKGSKLKKDEIPKLINAENDYLKTTDKLIACLDSVTVENTKEKRNEMNSLKQEYLKSAEQVRTTAVEVAQNSGLNVETYKSVFEKYAKQPVSQ
ncbi:hypothetical protein COL60_15070 [Bacillus pseudomycoides]|uniref:hypothetical protein n=1 Tax=Bacillus pseudomycoides TaxID=64104 RepID=UPI000BF79CF5|nr:hypothetical protein [Bacillus pseudomycoides]PFZ09244.1 hypothetical protein COL60_15070 [Bacillus pseudomycoides]